MINGKKVIAFICECNPFHEGHKRLIKAAMKEGDILIAIMSGNFVQRGEPAVYNKYERAKKLLKNHVDMVIELPVEYTLSSAKYFAMSSIMILNKLNFVDKLIFGSKIADVDKLNEISDINIENSNNENIKTLLKSGMSYSSAISENYNIKLSPNDILAVEYISAIKNTKSKIEPICIKRINDIPTASEIRKNTNKKISNDTFSSILSYKIKLAKNNIIDLSDIYLMTNDLYNSILKTSSLNISFNKRAKLLKTKNRTLASIKRILLNVILNIEKTDVEDLNKFPKYIRILGMRESFIPYLEFIKIPYLLSLNNNSYKTFVKKYPNSNVIKKDKMNQYILSPTIINNINATDLYNLFSNNKMTEATTKALVIN